MINAEKHLSKKFDSRNSSDSNHTNYTSNGINEEPVKILNFKMLH